MEIIQKNISDCAAQQIAVIQKEILGEESHPDLVKASAKSETLFFVEFDEKRVICFCSARKILDEWEIDGLATVPEYRNRGFAKKIMVDVADFAAKNGAKKIFLEVRESNEKAINLYEKCGFEKYLLRKNYYADNGETAVCMKKDLG